MHAIEGDLAAAGFEILCSDWFARHKESHGNLSTHLIRNAYHGRFCPFVLLGEKVLDLAGIDVKASGDNEVALKAQQCVVAISRAICHRCFGTN